jgi:alcohol dehydrogenase (cytochrome c)
MHERGAKAGMGRARVGLALALVLATFAGACRREGGAAGEQQQSVQGTGAKQAPARRIENPGVVRLAGTRTDKPGDWTMPAKDYASSRYSELDQITAANAKDLRLAWTFSTGALNGHEAAPIVVNDTMYLITPYPNVVFALDLTKGGALKWKFEPAPNPASRGVACCDVVNRGVTYADGRIFFNTLDNHTIALNAETGAEIWRTRLGEFTRGETMTMAPLVAKGKVFVGNSGGEMGVRGWITALNAADGSIAWRAYHTGPDADVLIDHTVFKPFYESERGQNLGVTTWPTDAWQIGGGTVWGWISYDPELDLIYYGTANPGPWNADQRPGDNKWTASLFARRPDDGKAVWAYQLVPHDEEDYDAVNENVLVDLEIGGRTRKVLLRPERNGYIYVIDRQTGEVLSADAFAHITWAKGIDLKTGRPQNNPGVGIRQGQLVRDMCPSAPGAKDWQPSAFSPRTGLMYIPHNNLCMDAIGSEVNYIAGTPYVGATVVMKAGPGGHRGEFTAWDPVTREEVWTTTERFPVWSGAVVTAGDVVFHGTMDRWFKALDAKTGALLWQHQTGSGIIGQPVTYMGPDGKQYVAILAGVGGWAGAIVAGALSPEDPSGALGFVGATTDLPQYTERGGMLYVFSLP